MARPLASLVFASLVLAACSGSSVEERAGTTRAAILNGTLDTTDKAVVYVQIQGGAAWCTGALIGPNLVLTNRVCVATTTSTVSDCTSTTIGPNDDPSVVVVIADDIVASPPVVTAKVSQILVPGDNHMCGANIALLVLGSQLAPSVTPLVPRLDKAPALNEAFTMVGYGDSIGNDPTTSDRRRSVGSTVQCLDTSCGGGFLQNGAEFNGGAGACPGDTGAPAIGSDGRIFGVEAFFSGDCSTSEFERIDDLGAFLQSGAKTAATAGGYAPPAWATAPLPDGGAGEAGAADGGHDASSGSGGSSGSSSGSSSGAGSGSGSGGGSGSSGASSGGSGSSSGSSGAGASSGGHSGSSSSGGCRVAAAPSAGDGDLAAGALACAFGLVVARRRRMRSRSA